MDAEDCGHDALGGVSNPRPGGGCEHQDREGTFLGDLLISHHHWWGGTTRGCRPSPLHGMEDYDEAERD